VVPARLRATLIGASALPLSIIPTFAVMSWLGYALNGITLLALSVVVGILVDDRDRRGREHRPARARGANRCARQPRMPSRKSALAVIATTATLVVVFLPTALMGGVPGLVFKQFGWTIVAAVLASAAGRTTRDADDGRLADPAQSGTHRTGAWLDRYCASADCASGTGS
jgi:multidrug efflux pump subunit AcrB